MSTHNKHPHKDEQPKEGSTAHKKVDMDVPVAGAENQDGSMPMGMTGASAYTDGDPDQKSTHVPPKTVESRLPDGSPKFEDAPKAKKDDGPHKHKGTATFKVKSPIRTTRGHHDIGAEVELDADEANSVHEHIEKV